MKSWKSALVVIIIAIIFALISISNIFVDYLWFSSLDFQQIFLTNLTTQIVLFALGAAIFLVFLMGNLWLSSSGNHQNKIPFKLKSLVSIILALFFGRFVAANWETVLRFINKSAFGVTDPLFGKDIGYFVFTLPFLEFLLGVMFFVVIVTTLFVVIDYFQALLYKLVKDQSTPDQPKSINFKVEFNQLRNKAIWHMSILVALLFFLFALRNYLSRFSVLNSDTGAVVGAGYAAITVTLPVLDFLVVLSVLIGIIAIATGPKIKRKKYLGYAIAFYILVAFVGLGLLPGLMQSFRVSPNEFSLEEPYIKNNINYTRMAYGITDVQEKETNFNESISRGVVESADATVNNIRLLDWRPLTQTYKQTQEIRQYYDLEGIDIDRYNIDGEYREVMVAPREMDQDKLQSRAKSWVNLHLVYTHGYGAVMSPVNDVTQEGFPKYFIKDIPPTYTVDEESIRISQPRVYYGEKTDNWIITNTKTQEFDYPRGDKNVYIDYTGRGGIKLDTFMKEALMAMHLGDIKLLLSSELTDESRVLFKRNIQERVNTLTPFLKLDGDPYMTIADGRMYWIQDAYTVSDRYPYSTPTGSINYIRNSVKVIIDAYNGDVTYYMMPGDNPVMETYSNIYPGVFKNLEDMPESLKKHIRYPEELFKLQMDVYRTYHMKDPNVFYNKEDSWEIPKEIYGQGQQVKVEPYYIIVDLPSEEDEEFVLMTSFTPSTKDNMIGWVAARSDGKNYGELFLYKFPKDRVFHGPSQIEAMIDQDSEISQQLTLWSQRGSKLTRGNLLVIPINNSLLYVEPLYLQSEQGELPQLKKVIVSDGNKVVMEDNLEEALDTLFIDEIRKEEGEVPGDLLQRAQEYYDNIQKAMQNQNWAGIGDNLNNLGDILNQMVE